MRCCLFQKKLCLHLKFFISICLQSSYIVLCKCKLRKSNVFLQCSCSNSHTIFRAIFRMLQDQKCTKIDPSMFRYKSYTQTYIHNKRKLHKEFLLFCNLHQFENQNILNIFFYIRILIIDKGNILQWTHFSFILLCHSLELTYFALLISLCKLLNGRSCKF